MTKSTTPAWSFGTMAPRSYHSRSADIRPVNEPIVQSVVFSAPNAASLAALSRDGDPRFYQRIGHPTSDAAAEKVAWMEGAEAGLAFGSGMAAISTTLLAHVRSTSRVVASAETYKHTGDLLRWLSTAFGVEVCFTDTANLAEVARQITAGTGLVYLETPSNPSLRIADIARIAKIARRAGAIVMVDSTFASPIGQSSLKLGADLVIHSGTKLIGGHSDVMCGFVAGSKRLIEPVQRMRSVLGGILDPHSAWLALRGMKTMALRCERMFASALQVAKFLAGVSSIATVHYPLLKGDPGYAVARSQMRGGGCVVSFSFLGGPEAARRFIDSLQLVQIATSLGGVQTTIELPGDLVDADPSHAGEQASAASPGLIRMSVGIEPVDEIIADMRQALEQLQGIPE